MKGQKFEFPYEDIIDLQRPMGKGRKKMSVLDRAAQFQPFSALTGYDAAVRETERLTEEEIEIDENCKDMINYTLQVLMRIQCQHPGIRITYFQPDGKKEGGSYQVVEGRLKKLDEYQRCLYLEDGSRISIERIMEIQMEDGGE